MANDRLVMMFRRKRAAVSQLFGAFFAGCLALSVTALTLRSLGSAERHARQADAPAGGAPLWKAPSWSMVDQAGREVSAESLAGAPYVVDFIFTRCTTACPLLTARLIDLQRRTHGRALRFVSISVDPDHDTREVLAAYAHTWNPEEPRWHLLSPAMEALATAISGFRVNARATNDPNNRIIHSNAFFLVDASGMVRGVYDSTDASDLSRLTRDVEIVSGRLPSADQSAPMPTTNERATPSSRTAIDPVCNMRVDVTQSTATIVHDGRSVHFCSDACRAAFERDPNHYN